MNEEILHKHLQNYFKKIKAEPDTTSNDIAERAKRKKYYKQFGPNEIMGFNSEQFYDYISKLWAMKIWGNKQYIINKLIEDNDFDNLKTSICDLLYGQDNLENRWDRFKNKIKGFGPAMMSEMLCNVYPNNYMIWNNIAKKAFQILDIPVPNYNYQLDGRQYIKLTSYATRIKEIIKEKYESDEDYLFIDYFFYSEFKNSEPTSIVTELIQTEPNSTSYHDEIIEYIKEIGNLLGYNGNASCRIADSGKIADAVWEFNVGNIGKIKYVFEVQESGSIDSLIVSLQNAAKNVSTQAVVAVSDEKQIEKIRQRTNSIIDSFNGKLRFWDSTEVEKVRSQLYDSISSINTVLDKDVF